MNMARLICQGIAPHYRIGLIIGVVFVALNLVGLDRSPVVWLDEVTLNDPAKELAASGHLRSSVFTGLNNFENVYLWQPPLQPLLVAVVYKVFGFGIWQTRIPGVLFGGATVIMIYVVAFSLFQNRLAAAISAVLLSLDPAFIQTARAGRMDTQALFLSILGVQMFLLFLGREGASLRLLALSGLAIGLAMITHPVAMEWSIAVIVLIMILCRERIIKLFVFGLTASIPGVLWLVYALRTPQEFKDQFIVHGQDHVTSLSPFSRVVDETARYVEIYDLVPFLLAAYVVGFAFLLLSPTPTGRIKLLILGLVLIPFFFNALIMVKSVGNYYLNPVLILAMCAGYSIVILAPRLRRIKYGVPVGVIIGMIALLSIAAGGIGGRYAALASQWNARDYEQVTNAVNESIGPGDVVFGVPSSWYALESVGASLRLKGEPDPKIHDFLIVKSDTYIPDGFRKIKDAGVELPRVFGKIRLESDDYRLQIWASEYLEPHDAISP